MMSFDNIFQEDCSFEDLFDFGARFSLPDNDFGFAETIPEFDLDSQIDALMISEKSPSESQPAMDCQSDSSSCKKASETQETNRTDALSQERVEEMFHADKRETSSVFSFDSIEHDMYVVIIEPVIIEPTSMAIIIPAAFSTYQKVLLKMIDEENISFLLKNPAQIDQHLAEFIACNVEVMTKVSCAGLLKGESSTDFVQRINETLKKTTEKRKDQKLRMIFNKIVKMLIKKSSKRDCHRESKSTKLEAFYGKYAPTDRTEFEECIKNCKFPSKKKLRSRNRY